MAIDIIARGLGANANQRIDGLSSAGAPYIQGGQWYIWDSSTSSYKNSGITAEGTNGADGNGIVNISKTSTSGLTDTYTITFEDGTTTNFDVVNGKDGVDGENGTDGLSAYQIAVNEGFVGTETEWLESLKGIDGINGTNGKDGINGADGKDGTNGTDGINGADATINGVNTLEIVAGDNITLTQVGEELTINAIGGGSGGTTNYESLQNKPSINNVELIGEKTLEDLGVASNEIIYVSEDETLAPEESVLWIDFSGTPSDLYTKSETDKLINDAIANVSTLLGETGDISG